MEIFAALITMIHDIRAKYDAWVASTPPAGEYDELGLWNPVVVPSNPFDVRNEWLHPGWVEFVRGVHGLWVTKNIWEWHLGREVEYTDLFWDLLNVGQLHMNMV
jgi:hypothetical protein